MIYCKNLDPSPSPTPYHKICFPPQTRRLTIKLHGAYTLFSFRNYIDVMNGYISETTHVLQMSAKLREFYDSWLKESYSINAIALSADGTINGAVMEVRISSR